LKEKGYRPEDMDRDTERKFAVTQKEKDIEKARRMSDGLSKPPRPEPEIKEKKVKKFKRKKLADELLIQYARDPKYRRALRYRYTLFSIGLLILIISLIISYQNYTSLADSDPSLKENGYNLMIEFLDYDKLTLDHDYGTPAWDVNKFLKLTSEEISTDFSSEFDYLIEVYDLSAYQVKYNRTIANNLAWSNLELIEINTKNDANKFKISTFVNLFFTTMEVHLVRIDLTLWEK